jgi:hypothetical protein
MSSDLWRWADPEGQQRTVRIDELRAALAGGLIAPNTPVWREGWSGWKAAFEVPELTSASIGGANGVVLNIPPPPLAMVAVQQAYESLAPPVPPEKSEEPPPPPRYVPVPTKGSVPPTLAAPPASRPAPTPPQFKTVISGTPGIAAPKPAATLQSAAVPMAAGPATERMDAKNLPTTVGIPSPLGTAGASVAARPPPPPVPAAEISASELQDVSTDPLPDDRSTAPRANGTLLSGAVPPEEPMMAGGGHAPYGSPSLPPPPPTIFTPFIDDINELRQGRVPQNKGRLIAMAGVGVGLFVLLIIGIASMFGGSSKADAKGDAGTSPSSSRALAEAAGTTAPPTTPATTGAAAVTAPPSRREEPAAGARALGDCTVASEEKTIAPKAVITSGIDAQAMNGGIALGFASAAREGVATMLDLTTLSPTTTVRTRAVGGDARHVVPMMAGGKLAAIVDADRKGDRLVSRRTVATSTLIDVGVADGAIVWTPHGQSSIAKLFPVEGDGAVEALRAIALTERKGVALSFRLGNAIHFGTVRGDSVLEPDGSLSTVAGLGQVGAPVIISSGDRVVVAWADRPGAQDDWQIRWTSVKAGAVNEEAHLFAIPDGGLGSQAMSPSLASLGGGRFLLAWTEGPVASHQVRAITFNADGSPSGSALTISANGVNAGQPTAVVGPDGHGAVAFLAAKGKNTEVHATAINCPPK